LLTSARQWEEEGPLFLRNRWLVERQRVFLVY